MPTVTDADLILGYLDPGNFLGGDMSLDLEGAKAAMGELGKKLKADVDNTALGVYQVVGEQMAAAARAHATDRGIDPRGLPVLAFGGAGPVHANYVADPLASVLSAFGTLVTPARLDLVRGALVRLDDVDWSLVGSLLDDVESEARTALIDAGISDDVIRLSFGADMRYVGQANEVTVDFETDPRRTRDTAAIRQAFEKS